MFTEMFLDSGNRDAIQRLTDGTLIIQQQRSMGCSLSLDSSLDDRQGTLHGVNEGNIYITAKGANVNVSGCSIPEGRLLLYLF